MYETKIHDMRPSKTLDANLVWLWKGHHCRCDWPVAWPSEIVCMLVVYTLSTCSFI